MLGIFIIVSDIDINNNEIVAKGTGIGTPLGYDNMGINNAAFNLNGNSSGYIYSNNITANGNGFIITGESPEIECNTINVVDTGLSDSYVIYASESCVAVHDNSISYVGNTNGTYDNAVISASESDMLIFNNEINANLVSCPIDWVETPPASFNYVPYCISQAIYFNECSAVDLSGNSIFVEYTNATASADTIYIVNVYGCDDAVIEGNNINGFGHTYIYGIVVRGENFTVDRNEINLESDEKYVCGIDIEGESTGIVIENTIYLESPYVAYGIYSAWNWAGDSPTVDYLANYI